MIFNFVYIVEAGRSVIAAARFYPPPYCRTEKTDSLLRKSSFAEFRPDKRSPPDTDISQQCCLRLLTFLDLAAAIGRQQVLQVVDLHLQLVSRTVMRSVVASTITFVEMMSFPSSTALTADSKGSCCTSCSPCEL